jgi:hypothetical protein
LSISIGVDVSPRVVISSNLKTAKMNLFKAFLISALLLLQPSSAAYMPSKSRLSSRGAVLPPSDDLFYIPPSGYENEEPGAILRSRTIEGIAFSGGQAFSTKGTFQLLYRSTDSTGNANTAVTTLIVPNNANTTRLLSYQTAEDSSWINCAPSYTLQAGSPPNFGGGDTSSLELLFITAALDQGWIVNVPDYEGSKAAYTSGLQAGRATLDSVRAALASSQLTGINPDAEYQMWGYSGGALASEWAAELQPSYAPELNFIGTAIGGVTPTVLSVIKTINNQSSAGLVAAGLNGLTNGFPVFHDLLHAHLIPSTADDFLRPQSQCLDDDESQFALQDIFSYFDIGEQLLSEPVTQSVLNVTGVMGVHGTPMMPLHVYKGVQDEISVVADTDALVAKFCAQGSSIEYIRDLTADHEIEAISGSGGAFVFLINRFNGVPAGTSCRTQTVATELGLESVAVFGTSIAEALLASLKAQVGPIFA